MRYVLALLVVAGAYLVTLAVERWFDLGVVAALLLSLAALWRTGNPACPCRTGTPACPDRRDRLSSTFLAAAMPLLGLTHADPRWPRTTIALYAAYVIMALVILLRRKSTPLSRR